MKFNHVHQTLEYHNIFFFFFSFFYFRFYCLHTYTIFNSLFTLHSSRISYQFSHRTRFHFFPMFTSFERFVKVYSLVNFSFFFVNFFHLFPMKDIYHFDVPFMPCSRLFWSDLNLNFGKPSSLPSEQTQK